LPGLVFLSAMRATMLPLLSCGILAVSVEAIPSSPPRQPHIVLVVVDDHGWSDLHFTGRASPDGAESHTPTIDAYAQSGVHLTSAYVQKVCSPTRTAILTGRYPHRMGMQTPFCGGSPEGLNLNETLLPQYLKDVGYSAHAIGKWHLGFTTWAHTPTFRGFESFYGYYGCAEDYFTHSVPLRNDTFGLDFHDDVRPNCGSGCSRPAWEAVATDLSCYSKAEKESQKCWPGSSDTRMCFACDDWEHYSTHLIAKRAVDKIEAHDAAVPLFLYLPFQDTHGPAEVPQLYSDAVDSKVTDPVRRELLGKLKALDEAIKNVTGALRRNEDMLNNTVLVYTTDNGGPIVPTTGANDDAIGASNWPLRGGKHNAYEGGVRATAFIWDGRGILHPRGAHNLKWNGLMHAVDWLPSLCQIAGCNPFPVQPSGKYGLALDGMDVSAALLSNGTSPRSHVVLDIDHPTGVWKDYGFGSVRIGDWKLMFGLQPDVNRPGDWSNHQPWRNVTVNEASVTYGPLQLFNVVVDPEERLDYANRTDVPAGVLDELQAFAHGEQDVAVYPFSLGKKGKQNEEGVWEPWLDEEELSATLV